ncbi:hypothetical protein ElyMa_002408200 [Elysia marginata]|uniref:Uncharacterized protein n=1 Tax=Elysia marginata TaxID=1093978 RepID=A0AAV4GHZ9_9GAST|nr:hypothetical protein ElyMa_002408200 [Elysia marginata]
MSITGKRKDKEMRKSSPTPNVRSHCMERWSGRGVYPVQRKFDSECDGRTGSRMLAVLTIGILLHDSHSSFRAQILNWD